MRLLVFGWVAVLSVSSLHADEKVVVSDAYVHFVDRAPLAFERAGILSAVNFQEGDRVAADTVVAKLRDEVSRANHALAKARADSRIEVDVATKEAEVAKHEYIAAQNANMRVTGTIPAAEITRLRLASERAELGVALREHEANLAKVALEQATAELGTFQIRAPFDGIVTAVQKRRGEAVQPSEAVLELVNTKRVRVDGYVPVASAAKIRSGCLASVLVESDSDSTPIEYAGKLRFVDVSVQAVRRTVRVWVEIVKSDDRLRDGQRAVLHIHSVANTGQEVETDSP